MTIDPILRAYHRPLTRCLVVTNPISCLRKLNLFIVSVSSGCQSNVSLGLYTVTNKTDYWFIYRYVNIDLVRGPGGRPRLTKPILPMGFVNFNR
jgi:hypothetical protein